jgi:hypothetical protein
MVDHRIDHRNEDLWTEHERKVEGETGMSVLAGAVFAAIVVALVIAFAFFSLNTFSVSEEEADLQARQQTLADQSSSR